MRTYGRRTQPDAASGAPAKKCKVEGSRPEASTLPVADQPQLPDTPKLPEPAPAKRGSILSFFKPLKPSSSAIISPTTSDSIEPLSTPPSSPPTITRSRERRRLTTRPDLDAGNSLSSRGREDDTSEGSNPAASRCSDSPSSQNTPSAGSAKGGEVERHPGRLSSEGARITLRETKPGTLNAGEASTDSNDSSGGLKRRAKWRTSQAKVQTTLSLSIGHDPGFRICRDCDMLYNPLNEKDRKDHARLHAASQRRKAAEVTS